MLTVKNCEKNIYFSSSRLFKYLGLLILIVAGYFYFFVLERNPVVSRIPLL